MAESAEIASEIEALAVHCRPPVMSQEQRATWLRDWCYDLANFESEVIRATFRDWRQSGNTKFPTPGQIIPLIRAKTSDPSKVRQEVWRDLSDAEYDALDLPGKERHHLILANQCEVRAGPMWRNGMHNGTPLRPEQMSDAWRGLRRRAENHRAEAKRLRELYRKPMGSSAPPMQFIERSAPIDDLEAADASPAVVLPSTAGKPDAGGLTPAMREHLARREAAA